MHMFQDQPQKGGKEYRGPRRFEEFVNSHLESFCLGLNHDVLPRIAHVLMLFKAYILFLSTAIYLHNGFKVALSGPNRIT
jgi:hypothetical protein